MRSNGDEMSCIIFRDEIVNLECLKVFMFAPKVIFEEPLQCVALLEMLSWMTKIWMKNHLVSGNNCNTVNL
jgi:hypothetical protein